MARTTLTTAAQQYQNCFSFENTSLTISWVFEMFVAFSPLQRRLLCCIFCFV